MANKIAEVLNSHRSNPCTIPRDGKIEIKRKYIIYIFTINLFYYLSNIL